MSPLNALLDGNRRFGCTYKKFEKLGLPGIEGTDPVLKLVTGRHRRELSGSFVELAVSACLPRAGPR